MSAELGAESVAPAAESSGPDLAARLSQVAAFTAQFAPGHQEGDLNEPALSPTRRIAPKTREQIEANYQRWHNSQSSEVRVTHHVLMLGATLRAADAEAKREGATPAEVEQAERIRHAARAQVARLRLWMRQAPQPRARESRPVASRSTDRSGNRSGDSGGTDPPDEDDDPHLDGPGWGDRGPRHIGLILSAYLADLQARRTGP